MGRLSNDVASWVSKLLDMGIILLKGTVVDCPAQLRSGNDITLSVQVYILPEAFAKPNTAAVTEINLISSEGTETADEKALRNRKASMVELFSRVNLKPRAGGSVNQAPRTKGDADEDKPSARNLVETSKKEIVGEGDEAEEVELEGEVLQDNDLKVIYKKYVACHALALEPPLSPLKSSEKRCRHDRT